MDHQQSRLGRSEAPMAEDNDTDHHNHQQQQQQLPTHQQPHNQHAKVILVTGASSGIGQATVRQFLQQGHIVYGAARRPLSPELSQAGVRPLTVDLTRTEDREAAVEQIVREQGGIDVLVNNAGYAIVGPAATLDMASVRRQFEVNFWAIVHLTQLVLPHMERTQRMRRSGRDRGAIIQISSILGQTYVPFASAYVATKHALEGWSNTLRVEIKPMGIDVVVVEPGFVATGFKQVALSSVENLDDPADEEEEKNDDPTAPSMYSYTRALRRTVRLLNLTEPLWTNPRSIARVVVRAATTRYRPRHRYVTGWLARPLLFFHHWCGTTLLDLVYGVVTRLPLLDYENSAAATAATAAVAASGVSRTKRMKDEDCKRD